jgi:hypothetical protein
MTISATTQGIKPGVCLSTNRPVNPFDGQVIYMTDVDQTAVWDGSQWTVLAPIAGGRNVIINGAMQVAQRGTSTAGITTSSYYTADRWRNDLSGLGTWTSSVENDAPTGSGLRKSLKLLCTTADASPTSTDSGTIYTALEGQNVQQFLKGTTSAKQFALSFWVKANVTGTYIAEIYDGDNSRQVSATYTISASATWEKKTIIFPADTTGAFDNDSNASLFVVFALGAGSARTSGTLSTVWNTAVEANRFAGQVNLAAATNNYWQVTGVQLEAGAVATPFEFEDYGTTLAKCQRYFYRTFCHYLLGAVRDTNLPYFTKQFPVTMRVAPTFSSNYTTRAVNAAAAAGEVGFYGNGWYSGAGATAVALDSGDTDQESFYFTGWTGTAGQNLALISSPYTFFSFSSEL